MSLRGGNLLALALIGVGCASYSSDLAQPVAFSPFADRPEEEIVLQHDIRVVQGTVFLFLQDGSRLTHHLIPVAAVLDSNTYVISVSSVLDMTDFMSLGFDAEADVQAVIAAAEAYCEQTNYHRVGTGATIWVGEESSALVEFCVPKGVELPWYYEAGDRVPRED